MKKALFLNSDRRKPICALYQAGLNYAQAMSTCQNLQVTYCDAPPDDPRINISQYDVLIFNYQHVTCQWMPPEIFSVDIPKWAFLYEACQQPDIQTPTHTGQNIMEMFDKILVPDPTLTSSESIWGLPRVVPRHSEFKDPGLGSEISVGTFGIPSPWKDISGLIRMMNQEYSEATNAVLRMQFSHGSHQEGTQLDREWDGYLFELAKKLRPGIRMEVNREYMSQEDLITWLSGNHLNAFLASPERGRITKGALLASTDIAIAAGRPIIVSDTVEARHLKDLIAPTLSRAMAHNGSVVKDLYHRWSPENFASYLDRLVEAHS